MCNPLIYSAKYYPFGMLERSYSDSIYRFGFGGHEKDNEVKGEGNHLAFGDYGYDTRLARRWNADPLQSGMPSWSSYIYSFNNPIMLVDNDGQWPGVTYFFYELDAGIGLMWGVNYVEQSGVAIDEVGKTQFTTVSKLYISNQKLYSESSNPQVIIGGSISISVGVTFDWSNETFLGDLYNYNAEMGGFEFYEAIGGELSFGESRFSLKMGLGVGVKLSVINMEIKQSISLSDEEVLDIGCLIMREDAEDDWILIDKIYDKNENSWTAKIAIEGNNGELIDTGILVKSKDEKIWFSDKYKEDAEQAEANNE